MVSYTFESLHSRIFSEEKMSILLGIMNGAARSKVYSGLKMLIKPIIIVFEVQKNFFLFIQVGCSACLKLTQKSLELFFSNWIEEGLRNLQIDF